MTRERIEPCPFCGGVAQMHENFDRVGDTLVGCGACSAQVRCDGANGKQEAIASWNRRASPHDEPAHDWRNDPMVARLRSPAEPPAWMFHIRYVAKGKGSTFAAIDYTLQDGEELISRTPLYAHPPREAVSEELRPITCQIYGHVVGHCGECNVGTENKAVEVINDVEHDARILRRYVPDSCLGMVDGMLATIANNRTASGGEPCACDECLKPAIRTALCESGTVSRDDVLVPVEPTEAMIDAGAQRLVSWDDGCKWPDSWSELQVAAARNDAEKVWRSMWLEASGQSHEASKHPTSKERRGPTEEELSAMVDRFLGWRLPKDFAPDHYITFDREAAQRAHDSTNGISWPIGTNLFTADQARAMLRYVLAAHEGRSHE